MNSIKRNQLKDQYKKFARSWGNEKSYQKYVVETLGQELPAGTPRLGRKPTFNEWKVFQVKQAKFLAKEKSVNKTAEPIPSLDWDEDEATKSAEETLTSGKQTEVQGQ